MEAFRLLCRTEGIIPAIESSHALAGAMQVGRELGRDAVLLVNLSGRGDKDVHTAATWFGMLDGEAAEGMPPQAESGSPDDPAKGIGVQA
jgi:tryptophan synthase beta chain